MSERQLDQFRGLVHQIEKGVSAKEIFYFLCDAWKTILLAGLCGLFSSIIYTYVAPKQYQAVAKIVMAQIGSPDSNIFSPSGISAEEPSMLISRLSTPTSFTPEVVSSCVVNSGAIKKNDQIGLMDGYIKLIQPKGLTNVVELHVLSASPEIAANCAGAIFEYIKFTQGQIIAPYIEQAKLKLADDEHRLSNARDLIGKAEKSGSAMGVAYLTTRDEVRYLLDEISALKNLIISNDARATHLVAPIYSASAPVTMSRKKILAAGLLGGVFLGILIALTQKIIATLKSKI